MNQLRKIDKKIMEHVFSTEVIETDRFNGTDYLWIDDNQPLPTFSSSNTDALNLFQSISDEIKSSEVRTTASLLLNKEGWLCSLGSKQYKGDSLPDAVTQCVILFFNINIDEKEVDENEHKTNDRNRSGLSLLRRPN